MIVQVMQRANLVSRVLWRSNTYISKTRQPNLIPNACQRNMTTKQEGTRKPEEKDVASGSTPLGGKGTQYTPNNFDKRVLVWMKKYPSIESIPPFVSQSTMERARNMFRIKGMIYMMVVTFLVSIVVSWSGKQAAKRGESVVKMNEEFHRREKEASMKRESASKD